jgi:uncharacterized membrane protein
MAHAFVGSIRRVDSLFGSLFEELIMLSSIVANFVKAAWRGASRILVHGLLAQEPRY